MKRPLLWLLGCFAFLGLCGSSEARDLRVAFLVANQTGWKDDPRLNYAITGDLNPMARALKGLGFQIHSKLANQPAQVVRKALESLITRTRQSPRITTIFFYYSGHAGKKAFHMGPKSGGVFSYLDFSRLLRKLKVRRRFVMLDACYSGEIISKYGSLENAKILVRKGGVKVKRDIKKYLTRGKGPKWLHIMGSSRSLAFESRLRKGSVFTYHILQGLQGRADLNSDGIMTFSELYNYARPKVQKETTQEPLRMIYHELEQKFYPFAPNTSSQLVLSGPLVGQIKVVVKNFVWRHYKRRRRSLWIRVNSGQGIVEWQKGNVCKRQTIQIPKRKRVWLSKRWQKVACSGPALTQKGSGGLVQLSNAPEPLETLRSPWALEFHAGPSFSSGLLREGGDLAAQLSIGARKSWFGIQMSLWATEQRFPSREARYMGASLRTELGLPFAWRPVQLFVGAFLSAGFMLQDLGVQNSLTPLLFQGGGTFTLAVALSPRWAVTLRGDLGVSPADQGRGLQAFLYGGAAVGLRYHFLVAP